MKTLLMFSLIFFSACFTNLYTQTDYQNPGTGSSSFLVKGNNIYFEFHQITDLRNGYTLQSNSSPQQLWLDLNNQDFLHAVFTNSQETVTWSDRTCIYFGSTDMGNNWFELGTIPDSSRAGFPAIYGTSDGAAVIVNHSSYFDQTTRTGIFLDSSTFRYQFAAYDPGEQPATIWPRCIVTPNNKVLIAAHTTGPAAGNLALNTFNPDSGTFSGWQIIAPTKAETYSLSVSNGGKIGVAFLGDRIDDGDVFYLESTDNGITWSLFTKIFDCPAEQGIAVGSFRGIDLNFYGEDPCVVFEICKQDFNAGVYYPRLPNEILFWSPNINGGDPKAIADSNNVPFAPNLTSNEVFTPLGRPVIGRFEMENWLCVAFSAATENVYAGADSLTYFAGYIMFSTDGGQTWTWGPEKFTPETPLLDWKYISGLSVFPVHEISPIVFTIHFVIQADSLEANPNPLFLSAQYYHASFTNNPPSVKADTHILTFDLVQNYPNPFNPKTKIGYQISKEGFVTIKVYDVLGNEIATLVNEKKPVGKYNVEFRIDNLELSSGIYFYQLRAVDPESSSGQSFVETKKMVLLR